jgi:hypothetical protein
VRVDGQNASFFRRASLDAGSARCVFVCDIGVSCSMRAKIERRFRPPRPRHICRCRGIGPNADGDVESDGTTRESGRFARAEDEARTSVGVSPSASAIARPGGREPRGAGECATRSAE